MKIKLFFKSHPLTFAIFYTCLYLIAFVALESAVKEPKFVIHCALDDIIPFNEYFIIPYLLWFLYIPSVFIFMARADRDTYWKMAFNMFGGMTVCVIIYCIFPNGVDLRESVTGDNICLRIVEMIRSSDTSTNVCPSIHVLNTLCVNYALCRTHALAKKHSVKIASCVLSLLICVSTVMLDQHSVIDIFCAIILFAIMRPIAYRRTAADEKVPSEV